MIFIVCPTVTGREDTYQRCVDAYENRTEDSFEIITILDRPACGIGWQEGAEIALEHGARPEDYLHFTADDLEPALGWDIEARPSADLGILPAPKIFNGFSKVEEHIGVVPDGFFTRIPFCTFKQWENIGPMIPIHYYTDNYFSWRGLQAGYQTLGVPSYAFLHHWAQVKRFTNEKMTNDAMEYERYKREGYRG